MRLLISLLLVFCSVYPLDAGRTIRISSPQFSFLIDEPDGWMIDVRSAIQIANFVVHRQGTTWRYADVVVFGRFFPREPDQTLEDFVKDDELRFRQNCPLAQIKRLDLDLGKERYHEFLVKQYTCAGSHSEAVAMAQVPGYFVLFSLTTQKAPEILQGGMDAFKELIESFRFLPGRGSHRSRNPEDPSPTGP